MRDEHALRRSCLIWMVLTLMMLPAQPVALGADNYPPGWPTLRKTPLPKSELNLAEIPFKIVYESLRKTEGKENW